MTTAYIAFDIEAVDGLDTKKDVEQHLQENYDKMRRWELESDFEIYTPSDDDYDTIRNDEVGNLGWATDYEDAPFFDLDFQEIHNDDLIHRYYVMDVQMWIVKFEVSKDTEYWELSDRLSDFWDNHPNSDAEDYVEIAKHDKCRTRLEDIAEIAREYEFEGTAGIEYVDLFHSCGNLRYNERLRAIGKSSKSSYVFSEHFVDGKEMEAFHDIACTYDGDERPVTLGPFDRPLWDIFL